MRYNGIGDIHLAYNVDVVCHGSQDVRACTVPMMTILALTPRREAVSYTHLDVYKRQEGQTQGKYLEKFEKDFAAFVGAKYAFGVNNCTNALKLAAKMCIRDRNKGRLPDRGRSRHGAGLLRRLR